MDYEKFLIIGGSKGIGRALADKIVSEGHEAIVFSRTAGSLNELGNVNHYKVDVTEDVLPELDFPLSGLVYCPGSIFLKPFRSIKEADFKADFNINVLGAIRVIQKYLPNLKKSTKASIVLFSTVAVQVGMPYHTSVAASKGAIEGLTRSLAAELAPSIRVNAIAPSLTETSLSQNLLRNESGRIVAMERHPLKRIGTVEEVAEAAWFVLSEKFSWSTGQILRVDGGLSSIRN